MDHVKATPDCSRLRAGPLSFSVFRTLAFDASLALLPASLRICDSLTKKVAAADVPAKVGRQGQMKSSVQRAVKHQIEDFNRTDNDVGVS